MPIEIRELVIRATVDPAEGRGGDGCGGPASPSGAARGQPHQDAGGGDDMVQACVREVLRILEEKRER